MGRMWRNKWLLTAVVGLVLVGLMLGLTRRERSRVTWVEAVLADALAPLQSFASGVVEGAQNLVGSVRHFSALTEENTRLRNELAERQTLEVRLREAQAENAQLRAQLGLQQAQPLELVHARVIGRGPDNWFGTLTINRGEADGVFKDAAVINAQGVVGRVSKVTRHTATVTLITDRSSGVGARVLRVIPQTRDNGVISGEDDDLLRLRLFSRDTDVAVGDLIVTSGLSHFYPPGLLIGTVTEVGHAEFGLMPVATVEPAVDFDRLEWLAVVIGGHWD